MFFISEGRNAGPANAFTAHMGEGFCVSAHPYCHEMAANTGHGATAIRYFGRSVVGATRAKMRCTHNCVFMGKANIAAHFKMGELLLDQLFQVCW